MRPPQGQMMINMKTTITTHGVHSGYIVHTGVNPMNSQSSMNNTQNSGSMLSLNGGSRIPHIETPAGTRYHEPLQIGPSTSTEHLNSSYARPASSSSPAPPQRTSSLEHIPTSKPYRPIRPSTPPSPVYDFSGRNSPPDEFIQPSKVTLNVFDPGARSPIPVDVGLRRARDFSTADALINDTVTTHTTVEVFRAPYDPNDPNRVVALPPVPAPGLDDRPHLLRLSGPGYENWSNTKTETLINDRPVVSRRSTPAQDGKAVQWHDNLVVDNRAERISPYSAGSRSPYANVVEPPRPVPSNQQYYVPTVHSVDDRLLPPLMMTRGTSPYMLQSPSQSQFSPVTHPIITDSREDLRYQSRSPLAIRVPSRQSETPVISSQPPLRSPSFHEIPRPSPAVDAHGYSTVARPSRRDHSDRRRSHSSHRTRRRARDADDDNRVARSVSPRRAAAQPQREPWMDDPNSLPGGVRRASSRDIFHLYQTRDVFDNVVAQFEERDFAYMEGLMLSPLADSEESLMSETSNRNDKAKSDALEKTPAKPLSSSAVTRLLRFGNSRNQNGNSHYNEDIYDNFYALPRTKEHIYEEIDQFRKPLDNSDDYARLSPPLLPREPSPAPPPVPPFPKTLIRTEETYEEVTTKRTYPLESTPLPRRREEKKQKVPMSPPPKSPIPPPPPAPPPPPKELKPRLIEEKTEPRSESQKEVVDEIRSEQREDEKFQQKECQKEAENGKMKTELKIETTTENMEYQTTSHFDGVGLTGALDIGEGFRHVDSSATSPSNSARDGFVELVTPVARSGSSSDTETIASTSSTTVEEHESSPSPDSSSSSSLDLVFLDEWPAPPSVASRPRKAHPGGHPFPRITSSVPTLPEVPEDRELTSSTPSEAEPGIKLVQADIVEVFAKEPKRIGVAPVIKSESHKLLLSGWETLLSDSSDDPEPQSIAT